MVVLSPQHVLSPSLGMPPAEELTLCWGHARALHDVLIPGVFLIQRGTIGSQSNFHWVRAVRVAHVLTARKAIFKRKHNLLGSNDFTAVGAAYRHNSDTPPHQCYD